MDRVNFNNYKSRILIILAFLSAILLSFSFSIIKVQAVSASNGVYFEIDKNPIESVEITSTSDGVIHGGDTILLSSVVYPENAKYTLVDISYEIVRGKDFATIENDKLKVNSLTYIGGVIEVESIVDGVRSSNSLIFNIDRTPVERIEFSNEEDFVVVGGLLKLNTKVYPEDATDKHVVYSIVSNTNFIQVSYTGVLSFNGRPIPQGDVSVTVRATSDSDSNIYAEKTFSVIRPAVQTIDATHDLRQVNQQCAYSFNTSVSFVSDIFGDRTVNYSVNVGSEFATVDANGMLYVTENIPLGEEIILTISSTVDKLFYEHKLVVVPVYATDVTPIITTKPNANIQGVDYYYPNSRIDFDVVFTPINVSSIYKVFDVKVSDEFMAYVDGQTIVIKDLANMTDVNSSFDVIITSAPNNIERVFNIPVHIPLEKVTLTHKQIELTENTEYEFNEIFSCHLKPANASVYSTIYELIEGSDRFATVEGDKLTVKDNLPDGEVCIKLRVTVNGLTSNIITFFVYGHLMLSA